LSTLFKQRLHSLHPGCFDKDRCKLGKDILDIGYMLMYIGYMLMYTRLDI